MMVVTADNLTRVRRWADRAWPVSAKTENEVVRKAFGHFGGANIDVESFRQALAMVGYAPVQIATMWFYRFPGPDPHLAKQAIRCSGV